MKNDYVLTNNDREIDLKIFGERVKELRTYHEITQADLAEMIGVAPATIISYEKNQKRPSIDVAVKMAQKFNISLNWLCGLTDKKERLKLVTYADVFKKIISTFIEGLDIDIGGFYNSLLDSTNVDNFQMTFNGIRFRDIEIHKFLNEYDKMRNLIESGTIDKDLFNLWLEKQLLNFDNMPFVPFNELPF